MYKWAFFRNVYTYTLSMNRFLRIVFVDTSYKPDLYKEYSLCTKRKRR